MTKKELLVGGQALIEGVMMKGESHIGIAVRRADGRIETKTEDYASWSKKCKILGWPFLRGFFTMLQMMIIGLKAITYSAEKAAEDIPDEEPKKTKATKNSAKTSKNSKKQKTKKQSSEESLTWWQITLVMIISILFALLLFKLVPLAIAQLISNHFKTVADSSALFSLIDGFVKIVLFILYVYLISLMKDMRRVFEYHGAEHCTVYCYESKKKLNVKNVGSFRTEHPRCGTSFIIGVLLISIIVYSFIPMQTSFVNKFFLRILFLPVIAGLSYELLRLTSKNTNSWLFRILTAPGIWTQKITTKKPDAKQIEVAIAALNAVLEKEK